MNFSFLPEPDKDSFLSSGCTALFLFQLLHMIESYAKIVLFGEMAEWFKAPVLKTGVGQLTVGSNPSLSAEEKTDVKASVFFHGIFRRKNVFCIP